jgi:hypothetical protein
MKKEITVLQAVTFVNSFDALPESGVSFEGLHAYDMACNLTTIEPEVIAFNKLKEAPKKYKQYLQELNTLQLEEQAPIDGKIKAGQGIMFSDGRRAATRIAALRAKYDKEIKIVETREESNRVALDKKITLELIEIPRSAIKIAPDSDRAAGVLAGLSIVIGK